MSNDPRFHPVYKSINKPLTIWGAERRLFFLALIMGGATFNLFGSLFSGLLMSAALFLLARWASKCQNAYNRAIKACNFEYADNAHGAITEWQKIFGAQFEIDWVNSLFSQIAAGIGA